MKSHQLQITVKGDGIRDAVPSINYEGVTIDSIARLDSPNYQFIYLTIADGTEPGKMEIEFKSGKSVIKKQYELLQRDTKPEDYIGFDSSDALYLIMPDRFADGNPENNEADGLRNPVKTDRDNPSGRHGGDLKGGPSGLHTATRSDRNMAHPGTRKRYARRLIPWICHD